MKIKTVTTFTLLAIILSNCAAMDEAECTYSDWTAVGYEDGAEGRGSDRFGDYRRACADYGITPDFQAWQDGRERGLVEFCQPQRGFQLGESGGSYNGVCANYSESAFLEAYDAGLELYGLRTELEAIETRLQANAREMARIDEDVAEIESIIILDETTAEERASLLTELRELSELRGELELEAEVLFEERVLAELALSEFGLQGI